MSGPFVIRHYVPENDLSLLSRLLTESESIDLDHDPLLLLKALNECYRGMWGHQQNDKPTEEEKRPPRFLHYDDGDDILLLFDYIAYHKELE